MAPLDDNARPFYFKQAGHCTRCREPFGHNATAYMVREKVAWRVLSYVAFTQWETAPVCDACVCVSEHAVVRRTPPNQNEQSSPKFAKVRHTVPPLDCIKPALDDKSRHG